VSPGALPDPTLARTGWERGGIDPARGARLGGR
jgi:hypothetical protein